MGGFIDVPLTNAAHIVVKGVPVWAAGRPDLLGPEPPEVLPAPVLRPIAVLSGLTFLLVDV